jgi:hypothetical protein
MEKKTNLEEPFENLFMRIPQFVIDPRGTFKYIQIECKCANTNKSTIMIRGRGGHFEYHKEIFDDFRE